MNEPTFKVMIEIEAAKEAAVTAFAIKFLTDRGYNVAQASERWERLNEFCGRLGIHHMTFYRAMERPDRPNVLVKRGLKTDRLMEIQSNAAFDAFVTRLKQRPNRESRVAASKTTS